VPDSRSILSKRLLLPMTPAMALVTRFGCVGMFFCVVVLGQRALIALRSMMMTSR
jgi:hypothetical protein